MQARVRAGIAGVAGGGVDIVVGVDGVIVVAPEHQNDRLVHLREVFGQLAQHGICIPDAGGEVFQRAHGAGRHARRMFQHLHPLVVGVVVLIIIGMVLHGDRVQEDGLVRGSAHLLVLLDDLVGHGIVGDKAAGPVVLAHFVHAVHVFQTDEILKAEVGVGLVAAPILGPEAVHRRRLVAFEPQVIGQGEHGFGDMLLVGLAAAGQEGHRVAGESFELHIAGAAAEAGAVGPAVGTGLLQGVQVGGNVGVELDAVLFQLRHIPVGFVHHINDGGLLFLLVLRGSGTVAGGIERAGAEVPALVHLVQQVVHRLLGIALRLVDLQIGQVRHEAGDDAVIAVIAVLHPGVRRDAQHLGDGGLQIHAEHQQADGGSGGRTARQTGQPPLLMPPAVQEKAAHHQHQHHDDGDDHAGLNFDAGRRGDPGSLGHLHQIPGQEGLTAQLQGVEVHRAGRTAQHRHAQRGQRWKAEDPVQQHPHQKQQQPGQKIGPDMRENKTCKCISGQRPAGDPLAQQQHDERCRRREHHPQGQKRFGSFHWSVFLSTIRVFNVMKAPAGLERTISLCFLHKASAIIIVTSPKKSTPDFTKNSHSQRFLYLLPEGQLLRLRGRFRQGRVHKDGIRADGLDLLPGDGQALVPAQQPEQPGPPQQDQALQPGGGRVKIKVIGPAKAHAAFQLHDLFFTQFPDGHGTSPLSATTYAGQAAAMQKSSGNREAVCAILQTEIFAEKQRIVLCIKASFLISAA